ncbi:MULTISPECIES: flagellar biosynthesis protein FlhA [Acidobacterium]|uniref:Flagellar biosynthesis protein FlhA n=1 Tax=Acidobacterium capsulatum (strain ATCC 51196 / DSM 11244 / BCRC 80197 / JCM 7670 / NBRC 15755 / NCIMB 13165 / 161) TaxID=240015 RepID=C1F997_ACIC5|nr:MULTISPECIES: flagellar biosynthesis protein FlhA [Acidobacterium]ACO31347.1 flagellar biosynthesis protein FlhA [Acidobacterium capsulatum ATCC 51196]HCT61621.1 flagellar biosynthesis protein FlhA [Acidobacterium sp.]
MSTATLAPAPAGAPAGWKKTAKSLALPVGAISVIFVMLVPVPAVLLDLLLGLSMATSVVVFLAAVQVRKAVDFSVFPTLLLLLTLFRLSLNIASSRRILLHGSTGTAAAGKVIEAFGQFVVGGNYVVGFVLFIALIAIQFLVVSHGAVRTAEVTARFTLDALPGKQMAIDADMNAGLINEATARQRRQAIAQEAEFYGAMDGAARFNQRDSLATILITTINIVAGLLIGTLQHGVALSQAVKTYTILTVGDGLVTMIPSLLVSVAGGIVLTRASSAGALETELGAQLFRKGTTLYIASGVLGALCLVPGLPKLAFLVPAVILAGIGRTVTKEQPAEEAAEEAGKKADPSRADNLDSVLKVDDLSLEIGFQLIPLVDEAQGGLMLSRVRTLRRHLAGELGFLVPAVHISDNLRLKPREYVVSLRGLEIGRWQTEANQLLAVSNEARPRPMQGKEVREPAFGANARWIAPELEEQALAAGYSVVDPATAISTHLAELIRTHAHELLSRAETKRLLDTLNESHPKLVEELVPKVMSLGEVQKVLQQLLREQVSIRDLGTILETLVEVAAQGRGLPAMVEAVRRALGRRLTQKLLDSDGSLPVMVLEPALEEALIAATQSEPPTDALLDRRTPASAQLFARISESLKKLSQNHPSSALPVLLCQSPARYYLRRWLEPVFPRITVLAPPEIGPEIRVHSIGVLRG